MRPEDKINLLKSINHAFGCNIMEDYTRDEQNAYTESAAHLEGYVKGANNVPLADRKLRALEASNAEIDQVLATKESRVEYFNVHYAENPEWTSHHEKEAEIREKITAEENALIAATEKKNAAKSALDEVYAKPFEPAPNDPDYSLIQQEIKSLEHFENNRAENEEWHKGLLKKAEASKEAAAKAREAILEKVDPKELGEIEKKYDKLYRKVEDATDDLDELEDELDAYIEEQSPEIKGYLNVLKQRDDDASKCVHSQHALDVEVSDMERNKRNLAARLEKAKGRAYPAEKRAYDEAAAEHKRAEEGVIAAKKQLEDHSVRSAEIVKNSLTEKKHDNSRAIATLNSFKTMDRALCVRPIYSEQAMVSAAAYVKDAYNSYHNSHSFIGRLFKFIKWTSAHKDYQDYLDVRKCYKDYMGERITDQALDAYVKGEAFQPRLADNAVQAAPVQEAQREQIAVNMNDPEREHDNLNPVQENAAVMENNLENEVHN